MVPAEVDIVPPTCDDFSTSTAFSPSSAATSAQPMPPAPAPTTTRSASSSQAAAWLSVSLIVSLLPLCRGGPQAGCRLATMASPASIPKTADLDSPPE